MTRDVGQCEREDERFESKGSNPVRHVVLAHERVAEEQQLLVPPGLVGRHGHPLQVDRPVLQRTDAIFKVFIGNGRRDSIKFQCDNSFA